MILAQHFRGILFFFVFWGIVGATFAQEENATTTYTAPALVQENSWTLVLVPDPQTYVKFERNQPIYQLMVQWIAEHKDPLHIGLVLVTGDLVEKNNVTEVDGRNLDQNSRQMWETTSRLIGRLNGVVPYIICAGNHDYGFQSAENRESQLDTFFPVSTNDSAMGTLVECGKNAFGKETLENAAYEYVAPNGAKYLVVSLEFLPRDESIEWAKELCARPEYANHFGIILTHSYLVGHSRQSQRIEREDHYELQKEGNSGKNLWEKLVYPSKNIRMVLCGHVAEPDRFDGCCGYRVDKNAQGQSVHQILFDTQALGGGWNGNGGDGWLELLEFSADQQTVFVRTFSPFFGASPTTQPFAWKNDSHGQFEINLAE